MLRILMPALLLCVSGCSKFKGEAATVNGAVPTLIEGSAGNVVLLSFGYTSCPDVCPTALSRMKALYKDLGAEASRARMAFVTVDPDRDTPDRLQQYVNAFDPRIVPVHLSGRELQETLSAYGVVAKFRAERPNLPYAVDHTSGFLLVDAKGKLRLRLPPELPESDMLADLRALIAEAPAQAPLKIEKAKARISSSGVGALYLDVVNANGTPDRLLRVETTLAKSAELHETVQDGSVAKMLARPEGFVVPAGGRLELGPGGKHVMLYDAAPEVGEATLVFEHAGRVQAKFVRAADE